MGKKFRLFWVEFSWFVASFYFLRSWFHHLFFSSCSRLLEIVLVSFRLSMFFNLFQVYSVVVGLLQHYKVVFGLRSFAVVVGCCSLFLLYCRFQVASGCLVSSV